TKVVVRRHLPGLTHQLDLLDVARQTIEVSAEEAGEALQALERSRLLERLRVERERRVGGVDARAAAGRVLGPLRVRRAVRSEEEPRAAGGGRLNQRL